MAYNSYNEYIFKNNLFVLLAIWAANYFASNNFRLFSFFLSFRIVILSEWLLSLLAIYNMCFSCREFLTTLISSLGIPYKNDLFRPGPLVDTFTRVYSFFTSEINKTATPTQQAIPSSQPKKDSVTEANTKLLSLFLSGPSTVNDQPKQLPTNPIAQFQSSSFQSISFTSKVPQTDPNNLQFTSDAFQNALFSKKNTQNNQSIESHVATAGLEQLYANSIQQMNTSVFASNVNTAIPSTTLTSGTTLATGTTLPKLKYTPCLKPPLRPSVHRERLLWYLSPTSDVIEDFKIEQMLQYQQYWHTFKDRADYDKLTEILLSKIFLPLSKSIEEYNLLLAHKNVNVANCPVRTVALSMTVPHIGTPFNLSDIASMLTMEDYNTTEAKTYIVERIKELSSGNRMAAFRFTPKYTGMPTDSEIIMHIFKYYLGLKEPYAIPPLIPQEGDVFKFLLIYIKITPELESWGLFKK